MVDKILVKNILVTGGCGFIGSHTCIEVINNGYNVIIVDNLINSSSGVIEKIEKLANGTIVFYEIDMLNKTLLESVFKKHNISGVIHFAGLKAVGESTREPLKYYQNNIVSTLNLLELMKKYNCCKLIFSSSATVYGNSESPLGEESITGSGITNSYGMTKHMIEVILKDFSIANNNFNITSLRYFNPIGAHSSGLIGENPNDIPNNLMPYILKVATQNNTDYDIGDRYNFLSIYGDDYPTCDGTGVRDYIHVVDLAKGHVKAIDLDQSGYHVFNLGSGKGFSVLQLVNCFQRVNNVKIPYKLVDRRNGDLSEVFCSPNKSLKELNWKTELNIEDMCRDAWKFQKNNPLGY
jgi:UDP-glucose 4-epimerase